MIDPSFFEDFVAETTEHLDEMETALLELESKQNDRDILNDVFRTVHTIKGSSEYLGVERTAALSHKLENLLELLRQGEMTLTPTIFDTLIEAKDRMSLLINDLETYKDERASIDDLLERIAYLTDPANIETSPPPAEDEIPLTEEPISPTGLADTFYDNQIQQDLESETDAELLEIFLNQHRENLSQIQQQVLALADTDDPADKLQKCLDFVDNLKSSANYMGYETVLQLYNQWTDDIQSALNKSKSGGSLDIPDIVNNRIDNYISTIYKHFPQLQAPADAQQDEPATVTDPSPASDTSLPETENYDFLTDIIAEINEVEAPRKTLQHPATHSAPTEPDLVAPEADHEIYVEDTDAELFEIFLQQLKENLSAIHQITLSLPRSESLPSVIDICCSNVQHLRQSANYMGFDKLVTDFDAWNEALQKIQVNDPPPEGVADSHRTSIAELNRHYLDIVVKCFPQAKNFLGENASDDHQVVSPTPVTAPNAQAPYTDLPQLPAEIKLEAESYEGDMDEELFDIFMQQLQQNLLKIFEISNLLPNTEHPATHLQDIANAIDSLRSSANYMGYEQLTRYFLYWQDTIEQLSHQLKKTSSSSWPPMIEACIVNQLRTILEQFPQLKSTMALPPSVSGKVQPQTDSVQSSKASEVPQAFPEQQPTPLSEAEPIELSKPGSVSDDTDLFEKLNGAFDSHPLEAPEDVTDSENHNQQLFENLMTGFDAGSMAAPVPSSFQQIFGDAADEPEENWTSVKSSEKQSEMPLVKKEEPPRIIQESKPTPQVPIKDKPSVTSSPTPSPEPVVNPVEPIKDQKVEHIKDKIFKQSLRVDAKKIDTLLNQVGELVVNRAYFSQLFHEMRELQQFLKDSLKLDQREMKTVRGLTFKLNEATVALGRIANELQEGVMKVRMLPISQLFNRYPRLVRDLARDTGKKVQLEIRGEDTELDKMIIEELSDPLLHIIRNAVDHGIESIEERKQKDKPEIGHLFLEAYHESNHVVIEIRDDGRGIDLNRIKKKALEKKIATPEEIALLSQKELIALIMRPGFSTAETVTTTSGRGVGMDVVKKNIENLSGTLEIDSLEGLESRFRIKIPLTLAIIQALLIQVADDIFTIPLAAVEETIRIFENETTTIEGVEVIQLRDSTLPLVRLREVFNINSTPLETDKVFVVVVSTGMRRIGLVVDRLIRQEEVVIKPLVDYLQENSGFSGATILGNGSISLILDVYELVNLSIGKHTQKRKAMIY